jgi:CTP:molybdopterin cytidylyltransferase MocA
VNVAAIILAAGASRRLGESKQNARLAGETLVERSVRVAHRAGLSPIFVISRAGAELPPVALAAVLPNPEAAEGMASSIRIGVAAAIAAGSAGAVILACDQPAVTPDHLRRLAAADAEILASAYGGRNGVPAYFPAAFFSALTQLQGDSGARGLLVSARSIPLAGGELDIDTPADLALARTLYGP